MARTALDPLTYLKESAIAAVESVCGHAAQETIRACISLMRPHQWTKNLACFAGLFFAGKALSPAAAVQAGFGFAAFCFGASFVYALNDIFDRDRDGTHPAKRFRPIPSGRLGVGAASTVAAACIVASLATASLLGPAVAYLVAGYIVLNIGYTLWLKNVVLVDVMVISCGFIARVLVGTEAVGVRASAWILLCAFFLSLFLGFSKRRAEIHQGSGAFQQSRRVLSEYSVSMLDRFCNMFATLSIASYTLFTVTSRPDHSLLLTCPPVVFGLLRYLFLIDGHDAGEAPDLILLLDRPLQAAIVVWVVLASLVLYCGLRLSLL